MIARSRAWLALVAFLPCAAPAAIEFAGYTWQVRSGSGGPGPNTFSAANVALDADGFLHLKISHDHGAWSTAEVVSDASFGFGTYEFRIIGRPDLLDPNVVLGLFNYPPPLIGPDTTNEIDIEFATWGAVSAQHGNWTVWPAIEGPVYATHGYDATLAGDHSTHRFTWLPRQIAFESLDGFSADATGLYASWTFAPEDPATRVPQQPLPAHMNLWLFQGNAPDDGRDVDITIAGFRFTPDCVFGDGFETAAAGCTAN